MSADDRIEMDEDMAEFWAAVGEQHAQLPGGAKPAVRRHVDGEAQRGVH